MKTELKWIALGMWWLVLLGLIGPFLISAESTIAVIGGFLLLGISSYATYRIIRRLLPEETDG